MRCPRRLEVPTNNYNKPEDTDNYDAHAAARGVPSACSFCGSLGPNDFLNAMRTGAELGPTDKNYKVYVEHDGWHTKFYFQHLSEDQMHEFIDLYNAKPRAFKIGYPGYFYVLPFFCGKEPVS